MNSEYQEIRRQSRSWICRAGDFARERFGSAVATRKADKSLVTDVDHAVQQMLLEAIARDYAQDAVIAEEKKAEPGQHGSVASANRCWAVDPIDGTRNYARGVPIFTISVALLEGGSPVAGWIYNPMTERMYSASADGGAYLNDEQITVSDHGLTGGTLIAVPSGRRGPTPAVVHGWLDRMVLRNTGSTALHLALLACGAFDVVFCDECRLWDIAAGVLIAGEAGAVTISLVDGQPHFPIEPVNYNNDVMPILAGLPEVVSQLLKEYQQNE
ncbi:MAG: inositol monophosphatase family protein [Planctomycetota bacterium]|jgi:myo-inositol-1(or 4)-monophosphatase